MTEKSLNEASGVLGQIEKFQAAKSNNFQINIDNWTGGHITDSDLRPETQAKIKQLLIDELKHLEDKFEKM